MIQKVNKLDLPSLKRSINECIAELNKLLYIRGDGLIEVKRNQNGLIVGVNYRLLESRLPKNISAEGKKIFSAFVITSPTTGTSVSCYLDEYDTESDVIDVECIFLGGSFASSDYWPYLDVGQEILVYKISGEYRCLWVFDEAMDCT